MILFISNSGDSLPLAYRLSRTHRVQAYIHNPAFADCYANMLPKVKLRDLPGTARRAGTVIFDMSRPNEHTKRDEALLRIFNCDRQSNSVFGPVAEKIRKHTRVIGSSKGAEQMELDRQFGTELAKKAGFSIPVTYNFNTLQEGVDFLSNKSTLWVFKPHENADLDMTYVEQFPGELYYKLQHDFKERIGKSKFAYMLQKKIDGVDLSTEGWFDGERFRFFSHTYEDKTLMNDGMGPHIGSQSNVVWSGSHMRTDVINKLKSMEKVLGHIGYEGPLDVNCLIADKNDKPYFLEWTPRLGFDAIFCLAELLSVEEIFFGSETPDTKLWSASQRVSVPPYPYEAGDLMERAKNVEVRPGSGEWFLTDVKTEDGHLKCSGADGIIGSTVGTGRSLGEGCNRARANAENILVGGYKQYRTDQKESAYKALRKIIKEDID